MTDSLVNSNNGPDAAHPTLVRRRRWLRAFTHVALALTVLLLLGVLLLAMLVKDHVRSLWSIRQVPGTKMFVMDYYGSYNLEEIRKHGIDVGDPVGSLVRVTLPGFLVRFIADHTRDKLPPPKEPIRRAVHSCSTVAFRNREGEVLLGRNFDWMHDAFVVLRIHSKKGTSSVAVLDPHYLGLDAKRLAEPSLEERFRLLFLPYLVMDGMNEHGVAIGEMALSDSRAPFDPEKPSVINPLIIRLILDNAQNTEEALDIMRNYNIHFPAVPCHYLIADAKGHSVAVEFIDGRVETISTDETWQVSTNHRLLGKTEADNDRACDRYKKASDQVAKLDGRINMAEMLKVMASVSVEDWTMWTSVYNLSTGEFQVAYRRNFTNLFAGQLGHRSEAFGVSR